MSRHLNLRIANPVAAAVAALGVASAVFRPAAAGAQVRRLTEASDSIPRALVEAVIDPIGTMRMMGGGSRPRLLVGTLPSGLAQRLWIPPGSIVLGGVESSAYGLAVIHSTMSEDSLNDGYRREQPRLGWTLPHERPPMAMMGFVAASAPGPLGGDAPSGMFCSGGTTLTVSISPLDPLTREIRVMAMNISDQRCQTPATAARPAPVPFSRPQYPTLVNPPGSGSGFAGPQCSFWNSSMGGGSTRLQTRMSVESIFAHYGKQLTDSGWAPGTSETVARSWARRDSTGATTELTLTARLQPTSPGCVEVQMDVRSRRPG